jgi:hypothetical protein
VPCSLLFTPEVKLPHIKHPSGAVVEKGSTYKSGKGGVGKLEREFEGRKMPVNSLSKVAADTRLTGSQINST